MKTMSKKYYKLINRMTMITTEGMLLMSVMCKREMINEILNVIF